MSGPILADSISVTIKPSRGITGTQSFNFHDDGRLTLLTYHSPSRITENPLTLSQDQSAKLRQSASRTLTEYLSQEQFKALEPKSQTLAIAHTKDGVTKSISSRKHSNAASQLIEALKKLSPNDQ